MQYILIGLNNHAIVDDDDYPLLSQFTWSVVKSRSGKIYAQTRYKKPNERSGTQLMHRMIMEMPPGDPNQVDHINGNTLDNRKENLRVVTQSQNKANRTSNKGKSKYKGVSWDTSAEKWKASIGKDKKHINLGRFDSEEKAAKAYDKAAKKIYGEYAKLNFPENKKEAE